MKELTSSQVRQMYLDFFKSKGHSVEPSASLVPVNDPTLLWINSGVATLKKYFDGSVLKNLFVQMILRMLGKRLVIIQCLKC